MLAIVIPYYNITFFEETLESLVNQTNKNFKVYIGNDSSLNDPTDLINSYTDKLRIIYKSFEKNMGKSSLTGQWDRCIDLVQQEDWIMILGDDDVLEQNVIRDFYKHSALFLNNTSLVRFSTQMINENSTFISQKYEHPLWEDAENSFYRKFKCKTRSSLSEYVFLKSTYKKYGFHPYPLGWHSDDRAWLEFSDGNKIYSINESILHIRISANSISGSIQNLKEKRIARFNFFKFLINHWLSEFNKTEKVEIIRSYHLSITAVRLPHISEIFYLFYLHLMVFDKIFFKKFLKELISPGSSIFKK